MTDLGTLPQGDAYNNDYSQAWGINNSGQVAGWSTTASGDIHAFLYSGASMTDLGTSSRRHSELRLWH